MTRNLLPFALAAAAALAGCNKESHTIVAGPDTGEDSNAAANAGVQLPPSIVATKLYRCADNSVVTVDYLSDNKTANVRPKEGAMAQVTTAEPGKPMTSADGFSVEGSPTSGTAKIAVPGHPAQTCKA
jgi:hypothetical protein